MPSLQQTLLFSLSGVLALSSGLLSAVVSGLPLWVGGSVLCLTGAELVNASGPELEKFRGELSYGLLGGRRVRQCGLGGRASSFYFFPELLSAIPVGLHVSVLFFCGVVVLFLRGLRLLLFNAFGRPYETLQGPLGLYLWTAISCVSSCLVMILFASEVSLNHLSDRIVNFNEASFVYRTHSERFGRCFWLFFLVFLLHAVNFLLIRLTGVQFPFRGKESELSGGAADLMY
ncbi:Clarin-1 [Dissostichus eleginoides]|uniref:Clarin-1 n=1 Tax=Dissostichus eleginoides TaxID=100907 RepID=A0AAD9CEC7_DISEL|nr:Clarin-1 [Dissostichus eleginoides]